MRYLLLSTLLLVWAAPVAARDCPSKLPSHLFEVTDSLSIGAEVRAFFVGLNVGEGLALTAGDLDEWDSAFLGGLRTSLLWTPFDDWSLTWEGEARYKYPGWENRPVPGLDGRLWQLYVGYDHEPVEVSAGMQIVNFGMSSMLDQRFVALRGEFKADMFTAGLLAGVTMEEMTRNASNCLWVRYTSETTGWRTLSHELDNAIAGATFTWKGFRPWRFQSAYFWARPSWEKQRSHNLVAWIGGPLIPRILSLDLEPAVMLSDSQRVMGSLVGELRFTLPALLGSSPTLRLAAGSAFGYDDDVRYMPVFENLSWGYLKRYSLYEGHLLQARFDWDVLDWLRPSARYVAQTFNFTKERSSDELDAGMEFNVNEVYWLVLSYVGLNLVGPYQPSHGLYAELRVVFGDGTF